jgi:lysozyme family protein
VHDTVDSPVAHKHRHESAGHPVDVPWWFVAIHDVEASRNFHAMCTRARAQDAQAGRRANPPFTFEKSARDPLILEGFAQVGDWSSATPYTGSRSPTLSAIADPASTSTVHTSGASASTTPAASSPRTVPEARLVSQQCGAGLLLRVMTDEGRVTLVAVIAVVYAKEREPAFGWTPMPPATYRAPGGRRSDDLDLRCVTDRVSPEVGMPSSLVAKESAHPV